MLGYILNTSKYFHVYVANVGRDILGCTDKKAWCHVTSSENPANLASRGTSTREFMRSRWFVGSECLWNGAISENTETHNLNESDPDRKSVV